LTDAAQEEPRELAEGQSDAVTVAFADADADVCGVARVGRACVDGAIVTSGLGLLFAGGQPVAVRAEGGVAPAGDGWGGADVAGVETSVAEPLRAWHVSFVSEDGRFGFDLDLTALSEPARLEAGMPAGKLGGMEGYDQLVAVRGSVTIAGADRRFSGRGQRGHSWGAPDWDRLELARTLSAWMEGDTGVAVTALRPEGAASHADEAIHAVLLEGGATEDGDGPAVATIVAEPRLSTTYDGEGRQRAAGLELFVTEESEYPHRAAGEVACGTTLDLGRLRLDCAFFRWHMDGRTGVGRYDILRRVDQ